MQVSGDPFNGGLDPRGTARGGTRDPAKIVWPEGARAAHIIHQQRARTEQPRKVGMLGKSRNTGLQEVLLTYQKQVKAWRLKIRLCDRASGMSVIPESPLDQRLSAVWFTTVSLVPRWRR